MRISVLLLAAALMVGPASAQSGPPSAPDSAVADTSLAAEPVVQLELVDALSSKTSHRGDTFSLRVAAPVIVNEQLTIPVGTPARGEVVEAQPSDSGGKPGMLVLSVRSIQFDGRAIPIHAPTIAVSGRDRIDETNAMAVFASPLFYFREGYDVEVRAGASVTGTIIAESPAAVRPGHIIFFRPRRNSAAVYRYGVREGDVEARLRNGAYLSMEVTPGIHEFQIVGPFMGRRPSQTLRLEVQPDETLYVEHAINFLIVSNRSAFEALELLQQEPETAR